MLVMKLYKVSDMVFIGGPLAGRNLEMRPNKHMIAYKEWENHCQYTTTIYYRTIVSGHYYMVADGFGEENERK